MRVQPVVEGAVEGMVEGPRFNHLVEGLVERLVEADWLNLRWIYRETDGKKTPSTTGTISQISSTNLFLDKSVNHRNATVMCACAALPFRAACSAARMHARRWERERIGKK